VAALSKYVVIRVSLVCYRCSTNHERDLFQ
jgi:hypothetical protein